MAIELRRSWGLGLGPISHVTRLLERKGIVVARCSLDAEKLDAFSVWAGDRPFVVLGADKGSAARSRLDACHELGHVFVHRGMGRVANNDDFRLSEMQAFRFAGAFLLPPEQFAADLHSLTLDHLRALKPKWMVSIGMMIKRANDLGLTSDPQAQRLWRSYVSRGWSRHEPYDDVLEPEEPLLLRRAIELVLSNQVIDVDDLMQALPYSQQDVEQLAGLQEGYLSLQGTAPQNVIRLRDRTQQQS